MIFINEIYINLFLFYKSKIIFIFINKIIYNIK